MVNIDSCGELFDLAFERDGAAAVPLANFDTEELVAPPRGFRGVGVCSAAGDCDEAAAAEQQ